MSYLAYFAGYHFQKPFYNYAKSRFSASFTRTLPHVSVWSSRTRNRPPINCPPLTRRQLTPTVLISGQMHLYLPQIPVVWAFSVVFALPCPKLNGSRSLQVHQGKPLRLIGIGIGVLQNPIRITGGNNAMPKWGEHGDADVQWRHHHLLRRLKTLLGLHRI